MVLSKSFFCTFLNQNLHFFYHFYFSIYVYLSRDIRRLFFSFRITKSGNGRFHYIIMLFDIKLIHAFLKLIRTEQQTIDIVICAQIQY